MVERLSPLDASFLFMEDVTTHMHVGGLMTFEPGTDVDLQGFVRLIGERLAAVPRYRQKVREVPARLGLPVWVDDPDFDLEYHVRRSALPAPGTDAQLRELVGRLQGRPLDRDRPLWEIYLVEGLEDGGFAIITKTHHAMVDGLSSIDIGAVLLDLTPEPRPSEPDGWAPASEPSSVSLAVGAVLDQLRRPQHALGTARRAVADVQTAAGAVAQTAGAVLAAVSTTKVARTHPLNAAIGRQRRYGTSAGALDDYKAVRKAHGGTVNDVVLTVVAGGLRRWLATRGEDVRPGGGVRAMVPVSVRPPGAQLGNQISALFVDLPVGEADPVARLERITAAMLAHKRSGQAVAAGALVGLVGLTPPTLHSLGARLSNSMSARVFNVIVTNVPGPQFPLYAMGARMRDMYPVVPLAKGQTVSIGITSYDGGVFYGLNADRDAMPDVDVLAASMGESLEELKETL
ncbi:WS/DGAT/MGAT family O-acyltransferase [Pseudonocardia broussonetiae]|uniref:Diacylglycerol O-acyltransferase n=1 Tax=Pseudonocardia broussonetiae TaxID=2736640 RepID=A0A6M6JKV3_9PSEU|nr:wax ester/triacylglycerol synthase family O-acyltransferase [Pseudonocardia broussonetiae]QJY47587.1 wax ester/triacylglycerol synthase family O-acyltransferase [Pseudonocardia broussonetiae]